jgi:hypothetical protein
MALFPRKTLPRTPLNGTSACPAWISVPSHRSPDALVGAFGGSCGLALYGVSTMASSPMIAPRARATHAMVRATFLSSSSEGGGVRKNGFIIALCFLSLP